MPVLSELPEETRKAIQRIIESAVRTFEGQIRQRIMFQLDISPGEIKTDISIRIGDESVHRAEGAEIKHLNLSALAKDFFSEKNLRENGASPRTIAKIIRLFGGSPKYGFTFEHMTVFDVMAFGKKNFKKNRNVGSKMITAINNLLKSEGFELEE